MILFVKKTKLVIALLKNVCKNQEFLTHVLDQMREAKNRVEELLR